MFESADAQEAGETIATLNGEDLDGSRILENLATDKHSQSSTRGNFNRDGGYGSSNDGYGRNNDRGDYRY